MTIWRTGMKATLREDWRGWCDIDTGEVNDCGPAPGRVYEVDRIELIQGELGLGFAEFPFSVFDANAFRPVKTTKTGMAILRRLQLPKRARQRA